MIKYLECPDTYFTGGDKVTVFLAGGITGCFDWQKTITMLLADSDLVIFNPRRDDFPIDDPFASETQIEWEFDHLARADRILFWFPTVNAAGCPIALFELGRWLTSDKPIAVGVEPGYEREADVRIQVGLARPDVNIVSTLADLAEMVK